MAKERIIRVVDTSTNEETLVAASNLKKAISHVVGQRFEAANASAEDVTRLVNSGHKVQKLEDVPLKAEEAQSIVDGAHKAAANLVEATTPQGGVKPAQVEVQEPASLDLDLK